MFRMYSVYVIISTKYEGYSESQTTFHPLKLIINTILQGHWPIRYQYLRMWLFWIVLSGCKLIQRGIYRSTNMYIRPLQNIGREVTTALSYTTIKLEMIIESSVKYFHLFKCLEIRFEMADIKTSMEFPTHGYHSGFQNIIELRSGVEDY